MGKLINGNPHWHRVWELSEFFRGISILVDKAKVDMDSGFVCETVDEHICGTPACHGGWAAAFGLVGCSVKRLNDGSIDYNDGADGISEFLGFPPPRKAIDECLLIDWARLNPDIWGNDYGDCIFSKNIAFDKCFFKEITLKDIADHWLKVAKRLYKLQELNLKVVKNIEVDPYAA